MKKIILICLFAGLLTGGRAQNPQKKMTSEEREQVMSVLGILHEFETGDSFAVTDYGSENGSGRKALPWQRWAEDNRNRSEEVMTLLKGLSGAVICPVEGDPMACEVVMRCRAKKTNRATIGMNLGYSTKTNGGMAKTVM